MVWQVEYGVRTKFMSWVANVRVKFGQTGRTMVRHRIESSDTVGTRSEVRSKFGQSCATTIKVIWLNARRTRSVREEVESQSIQTIGKGWQVILSLHPNLRQRAHYFTLSTSTNPMDTGAVHDSDDKDPTTAWEPTKWISQGRKYGNVPLHVHAARRRILGIPTSVQSHLSTKTMSVSRLLLLDLPPMACYDDPTDSLSYMVVQLYEHLYRRQFKCTDHNYAVLGTLRFGHLPANSFLSILPQEDVPETVKEFRQHVEIGPRGEKIFDELLIEREVLAKAVASLNTIRLEPVPTVSNLEDSRSINDTGGTGTESRVTSLLLTKLTPRHQPADKRPITTGSSLEHNPADREVKYTKFGQNFDRTLTRGRVRTEFWMESGIKVRTKSLEDPKFVFDLPNYNQGSWARRPRGNNTRSGRKIEIG
ncbi:hypothetical protein C8R44DRAFT_740531 [Mycena epipterygia]|nr:hypothetical protein C8R44DRAFT_740531 [Mycena epipterygia]